MSERLKTSFSPSLVTGDGFFSGYGAIFGNIDSHRDVIERGAFADSLRAWQVKGKLPAMRLQHGSAGNPFRHDDLPIGKWTSMREDAKGLWVEGKLLALDTDQGKRIHALLAASVLDGLSIGFVPKKTRSGSGRVRRYLVDVDLREISIVDEPSNDLARIAAISPSDQAFDKLRDALTNTAQKSADPETSYDKLIAALRAAT